MENGNCWMVNQYWLVTSLALCLSGQYYTVVYSISLHSWAYFRKFLLEYDLMLVERLWVLSNRPGGGDCGDGQRGGWTVMPLASAPPNTGSPARHRGGPCSQTLKQYGLSLELPCLALLYASLTHRLQMQNIRQHASLLILSAFYSFCMLPERWPQEEASEIDEHVKMRCMYLVMENFFTLRATA